MEDWTAEMGRRQYYSGGRRGTGWVGRKAGCQCPDRGRRWPIQSRGHGRRPFGEEGEGGEHQAEGRGRSTAAPCVLFKGIYTHTYINTHTHTPHAR